MDILETIRAILDILTKVVVIFGVPVGMYKFFQTKRNEKRAREDRVFDSLNEEYIGYQKLCLEYHQLDVFDVPKPNPKILTEDEKWQEIILFTILACLFERAYLLYRKEQREFRRNQWPGWEALIESYCKRENFKQAYQRVEFSCVEEYKTYMAQNFDRVVPITNPVTIP